MKKIKAVLITVLTFALFMVNSNALKCDTTEQAKINQEASNVKLTYEVKTERVKDNGVQNADIPTDGYINIDYFEVTVLNVTENLIVKIKDSINKTTRTISYSDTNNGVYTYRVDIKGDPNKLTYEVITSNKTSCSGEEVFENSKTLPIYNYYYSTGTCATMKNDPSCQKYVTEEVTPQKFEKVEQAYRKLKNEEYKIQQEKIEDKNLVEKFVDFVKENKIGFIIGGSIIIVAGVVATVVVIKKRRSRLI